MTDPKQVAMAFVKHYYTMFDSNRQQLAGLYQDASKLSFEGQSFVGTKNIMQKLLTLKFQKSKHTVTSLDVQPSGCGGLLVFVAGTMNIDGDANAVKFSQMFHLMPTQQKTFWVHNDIFRLNYG
eukprot:TRINITY_DN74731_c0_g1_i1.p2 TRINITY_DN74731_c0_g1~~TRINITY_DN74731_c0_g1_i1.p2  ORF type:complete len:144 (+),score=67.19 TRINITY_DN74731_c0_g1_i1:61-432(+)